LTGLGVLSFSATITYNSAVVTFAGVDNSGTLSSTFTVGGNVTSPGVLQIAGYGTTPLSGSGTLVNIRFTAVGPVGSTTPLTFTALQFNESGCVQVLGSGSVTVVGRAISGAVLYGTSPTNVGVAGVSIYGNGGSGVVFTDASGAYTLIGLSTGAQSVIPSVSTPLGVN